MLCSIMCCTYRPKSLVQIKTLTLETEVCAFPYNKSRYKDLILICSTFIKQCNVCLQFSRGIGIITKKSKKILKRKYQRECKIYVSANTANHRCSCSVRDFVRCLVVSVEFIHNLSRVKEIQTNWC